MAENQPRQDLAPFSAWLRDQNAGKTHTELTDALHDVVAAVRETGKAGQITFTVKVSESPQVLCRYFAGSGSRVRAS